MAAFSLASSAGERAGRLAMGAARLGRTTTATTPRLTGSRVVCWGAPLPSGWSACDTGSMAGAVLLLEDDPALYSVLVEVFADDGLEVIPCVSPDEVQRTAGGPHADVAVIDIWEPAIRRSAMLIGTS